MNENAGSSQFKVPFEKIVKFLLVWDYFKFHLEGSKKSVLSGFIFKQLTQRVSIVNFISISVCYLNKNVDVLF